MLNCNEYEKWCNKLDLSNTAIEIINRVRESEPSRKVGGGSKNVVGAYPSQKMGKSIQFESHKVELAGLYLKEHDDGVLEMYDQPPSIKISYKSLKEKVVTIYTTPDYFVLLKDKAGWEEWKTEEELFKISMESPNRYVLIDGIWHCPPGEAYAEKYGLHYWVKSSKEINWFFHRNIVFLEDYLLDKRTELDQEVIEKVLKLVQKKPGISISDILSYPEIDIDSIYYMIARKLIFIDLDKELITEPDAVHIFTNKQNALAHKILTTNLHTPKVTNSTLNISPGVRVVWDGNTWMIINVGDKNISLSSDTGIVNINKEQFFVMVCQRQIVGVENEVLEAINSTVKSMLAKASKDDLEEANIRYKTILPILHGLSAKDISPKQKVTLRTIRNWVNKYLQAEKLYGFGFIGLIPDTKGRGNRVPRLPEDTLKAANEFLDKNETATNQSYKVLYGKFSKIHEKDGIIIPSVNTFNKIIKSRSSYSRDFKTKGSRVAYQKDKFYWELELTTPRHGERPFEIAHLDHTELDLQLVNSITGKPMGRAWLSLMMDAYSRKVLAFFITFDAPSYRSNMMIIRECVRRYKRLPQTIVIDNGHEFKNTYFESLLSFQNVTYKYRPAHKARFGSVGERLFGTTTTQLIHNLQGNTKIMKNVRQVTKSVNPVNHATWTLPELYELLSKYFYEFYDTHEHSSLCESPSEVFSRGMAHGGNRDFRIIPYNEDFYIMTLPGVKRNNGTAKVDIQRGVKVNYRYYYCDEFYSSSLEGTRVDVRYDPCNMGIVYCYVRNRWVKCYSEYYSVFANKSENEIKIASQELLKQKQNYAIKADISAKELASFIMRAEASEELLNQRARDGEMMPQLRVVNGGINSCSNKESGMVSRPDFNENETFEFDLDDDIPFD